MAQYKMNLSFQELKIFLKKKECPNCGRKNLKKKFYKEYLSTARGKTFSNNICLENYYEATPIYYCEGCQSSYTLEGLRTGVTLAEEDKLMGEGESKESVKQRDLEVTEVNRIRVGKLLKLISSAMFLFILHGAIVDKDWRILLVFGPFILSFTLVARSLTK